MKTRMICLKCEIEFDRNNGPHLFDPCPKCGCPSITTLAAYNYNPNTEEEQVTDDDGSEYGGVDYCRSR